MRGCIDGQQSTLLPLVVIFAPLSIAQASLTLLSLIAKSQQSIDELRIVPLVSLDDARGDFLQIKYGKTC